MGTAKPYLDTRVTRKSGLYPLYVIVEHREDQRFIPVGFRIKPNQWAKNRVKNHEHATVINSKILNILQEATKHFADRTLNDLPVDIYLIGTGRTSHSLPQYIEYRAKQLLTRGSYSMNKKYNRLAFDIRACFNEMLFSQITPDALRILEGHLAEKSKNKPNTIHKKFQTLGEIFKAAVEDGKATGRNLFKEYKIKTTQAKKEKLSRNELEAIEALEPGGMTAISRDMFLLSYYCKGQRFENVLFLKLEQIKNGRIHFATNKSRKFISVKIHSKLQQILDRYQNKGYVFPLVKKEPADRAEAISVKGTWNAVINKHLKIIQQEAGIETKLTFHLGRHSFAYHMKGVTESIHVISDSLGHSSTRITEIYLKALDDERLDKEVGKLYGE